MTPVVTHRLTKHFGSFTALDSCTLEIPEGEVFGLLGPNGAGKTTLIRLLLGFIQPSSGSAHVFGLDVGSQNVEVRSRVAYLPGDARLPRHMKSKELLKFFADMHPMGNFERSVEVAERLELDLSRRVAFMSTGMRQKLALATVLGPNTPLLILDEPTANLDPSVRSQVLLLVREAQQEGRTVIFSSHVLSEIEDVCNRVVFLRRGNLVLSEQLSNLRDRHLIRGTTRVPLAEPPKFSAASVTVQHQSEASVSTFSIDAAGALEEVLQWLLALQVSDLRIEPVRLRTIYNSVHRGDIGLDPTSLVTAMELPR